MKRFISFFAAAALLCQAAAVLAQDFDEPSEQSVLDAARSKYSRDSGPSSDSEEESGSQDRQEADADAPEGAAPRDDAAYTPLLISLVPGISFPLGYYDSTIAAGAVANMTRDISGAEGAGVFNLARDLRGFQGAGVFNIARSVFGFQGAGVFNIVDRDFSGFQGAGVFNIVDGQFTGFQGAGVFNIGAKVRAPIQGAGVFNIVDEIVGFQGAGLFNIAGRVVGGQAAGLFNAADRVTGVQIGVVNVAGHIDGVQLGLLNFAGNGINSASASYEPATGFVYAYWQAGTPALYTIAGLGAPKDEWFHDRSNFIANIGFGSRTRAFGLDFDLDVSAAQAIGDLPLESLACKGDKADWEGWKRIETYPSVRIAAGLPIGRHLRAIAGLKADIDIDYLGARVPETLKTGDEWRGALFDQGFTAYYKWFFGINF